MAASNSPGWFGALSNARVIGPDPPPASAVEHDSRRVAAGAVFVALRGAIADGHAYVRPAVDAGALALVVQEDAQTSWAPLAGDVPIVVVPDTRIALAEAAAGLHHHPARALGTVGVTGTDGKTTTTHLIAHLLRAVGLPAGYLSSVAFGTGGESELNRSHMTTVEANEVQSRLAQMRDAGDRYAVIEASSIGLEMHRVDQCEFDVAVFTNLTPDHLDFHETMDAYRAAKAGLFRMVSRSWDKRVPKAAVVNVDDAASGVMLEAAGLIPSITYALTADAALVARDITMASSGTRFAVTRAGERVDAFTPLLGAYNVANSLAAIAVALSQNVALADAAGALESFPGVPGRMEAINQGQPFRVIVDIASTEQAMRNVLAVLRPATVGRLIVVFGAAGERDRERRVGLARAVAADADYAVLANEDPRGEDPDAIIDEIATGLADSGFPSDRVERIADRRAAIARAFAIAGAGDTVLLAGKATEPSIVMDGFDVPWDERAVAQELLRQANSV